MRLVGMREFGAVPVTESLRLIYGIIYKKLKITKKKKIYLEVGNDRHNYNFGTIKL